MNSRYQSERRHSRQGVAYEKIHRTRRAIALFEAFKGIVSIAAGIGLLSLVHQDVRHIASQLISHMGMSPSAHYPSILLHYADVVNDTGLQLLLILAVFYAAIRLAEAYGLWNDHEWAEWMGALSGAIYIPFEIEHIVHLVSFTGIAVFLGNLSVVGFLANQVWRRRNR